MTDRFAEGLAAVAASTQHTVIADTDHEKSVIPALMAKPAVLDGLAKAGVKHLFLELPASTQPLLNLLTEGVNNPTGFARIMAENPQSMRDERGWQVIGELAQRAAQQHGIKVYAADERADRAQEFAEKTAADLGTRHIDFESVANYMKQIEPATLADGSVEGPLTNDQPLAKFIQKHAGNEKSATLFGESHGGRKFDLDEMLGNAKRVQIFANEAAQHETQQEYQKNRLGFVADPDTPAMRYFIDTQKLEMNGDTVAPTASSNGPARSAPVQGNQP